MNNEKRPEFPASFRITGIPFGSTFPLSISVFLVGNMKEVYPYNKKLICSSLKHILHFKNKHVSLMKKIS